jgi:hypothetical protein
MPMVRRLACSHAHESAVHIHYLSRKRTQGCGTSCDIYLSIYLFITHQTMDEGRTVHLNTHSTCWHPLMNMSPLPPDARFIQEDGDAGRCTGLTSCCIVTCAVCVS